MEWINLAALVVIPILAVIIAQYLQDRSEKRKDKMRVFSHLMSYRSFGYVDQYSVNVFNSVPIVFYDDKDVILFHSFKKKSNDFTNFLKIFFVELLYTFCICFVSKNIMLI